MSEIKQRVFIAFLIKGKPKKILSYVKDNLKEEIAKPLVKWVEKKNFHQSIVFLDLLSKKEIAQVRKVLAALDTFPSFNLNLYKIDFFPDKKRARIISVGLKGDLRKLKSCFHKLRMGLQELGFEFDTRFTPHITLGRVRCYGKQRLKISSKVVDRLNEYIVEQESEFVVDKITLFKSELTSRGPIYTTLTSVKLKNNGVV